MEHTLEILFEDADMIVCRKPAGLATETAVVGRPDAVSELKKALAGQTRLAGPAGFGERPVGGEPYLGVVHRLDQPVEGLLVFGKNKRAAARLSAQLGEGALCKGYRAVVWGRLPHSEGTLTDYLYKDRTGRAVIVPKAQAASFGAKRAVLRYRVLGVRELWEEGAAISLLDIQLETGRFHQIRAQMAHAGHPLLGDQKYGSRESLAGSRRLEVQTVALCACALELTHPVTGKRLHFTVEPRAQIFGNIWSEPPSDRR